MSDREEENVETRRRRPRYAGKYPRRFEEKYKELNPTVDPETIRKVLESGKTPAGMHRPIMVAEILDALAIQPGDVVVDATLGWGGHTERMLPLTRPGGMVVGLDCDPIELPRTEERLRMSGFGPEEFRVARSNFSGLPKVLADLGLDGADAVLADLGLSSMQIDNPARGFSVKFDGPLDMRMNPSRGLSAADWLARVTPVKLAQALEFDSDEPDAEVIAAAISGRRFQGTRALAEAVRKASTARTGEERDLTVRRVFQAIRIEVNDEFGALESFLRVLPSCLRPGARVAIMSFHSGEDRRVKKSFKAGLLDGTYSAISDEVIRAASAERRDNPRSTPARLRWARRA